MPLLKTNRLVDDPWVTIADDAEIPTAGYGIINLPRLKSTASVPAPLGVFVTSDTSVDDLLPYLDAISLIAIDFPKYRDGRGFTIARSLVERHGFKGEIRAVGAVLPDQHPYLLRCGFTTVSLPAAHQNVEIWIEALKAVQIAYQPALTAETPLSSLRRRLTGAIA